MPAVGRGEEARIQATTEAYERAVKRLLDARPDCLVITSPHAPLFRDGFHITTDDTPAGNMARFRAADEHLETSGDLSHKLLPEGPYGFAPEGPVFDQRIGEIFESGALECLFDFDEAFCEAAAECSLRSFQIMAGALDDVTCETQKLSNEGPFGVGYGLATCFPAAASEGASDSAADPYVALARLSVETFVKTGRPAALPSTLDPQLLERRAGVFISLHKRGDLRGCIGTISATTDTPWRTMEPQHVVEAAVARADRPHDSLPPHPFLPAASHARRRAHIPRCPSPPAKSGASAFGHRPAGQRVSNSRQAVGRPPTTPRQLFARFRRDFEQFPTHNERIPG